MSSETMSSETMSSETKYNIFPKTWELFEKLPIAVREPIWKMATGGRLIEVRYDRTRGVFYAEAPDPMSLAVCEDSKSVILEIHERLIIKPRIQLPLSYLNAGVDLIPAGKVIFETLINFKKDTLYLSYSHNKTTINPRDNELKLEILCDKVTKFLQFLRYQSNSGRKIQSIALPVSFQLDLQRSQIVTFGQPWNLMAFNNLKKITLVYGEICCSPSQLHHEKAEYLEYKYVYGMAEHTYPQYGTRLRNWFREEAASAYAYSEEGEIYFRVEALNIDVARILRAGEAQKRLEWEASTV